MLIRRTDNAYLLVNPKPSIRKNILISLTIILFIGFIIGIIIVSTNKYDSNYTHVNAIVDNCTFIRYIHGGSIRNPKIYTEYYLSAKTTINNITYKCNTFTDVYYNLSVIIDAYVSNNDCILFDKPIDTNYDGAVIGMCALLLLSGITGTSVCYI